MNPQKAERQFQRIVQYMESGDTRRAFQLCGPLLKALPDHPNVLELAAHLAFVEGQWRQARTCLERLVKANPTHAGTYNNLALALRELQDFPASEAALRKALALEPKYLEALNNLGSLLLDRGRFEEAAAALDSALALAPDDIDTLYNAGNVQRMLGNEAQAAAHYRRALARAPDDVALLSCLATLHEQTNALDAAAPLVERGLAVDPGDAGLVGVKAKLLRRDRRFEEALAQLDHARLDGADPVALRTLAFERGQVLDRLGRYEEAFAAFAEANRLAAADPVFQAFDPQALPGEMDELHSYFAGMPARDWVPLAAPDEAPVFVFGFPRSGTTLLDRMLDSHPTFQAMTERPALLRAREQLLCGTGKGYPESLAGMDAAAAASLRERYWAEAARFVARAPGRRLLDKNPLATIDVPLIWRLFPQAHFVLVLRHPLDVCLSCFMQPFAPNHSNVHFLTLESTARFYDRVMALWALYAAQFPLSLSTLRYEDLVTQPKRTLEALLAFLGADWDEAVMDFAERTRGSAVTTASYAQVTEPLYDRSRERWRNYRAQVEPAIPILRPHIERFGYSV